MTQKNKKNELPLMDGLTRNELDELKIKKEIERLHYETKEKKRGWIFRNLGVIIPSITVIATIIIGYVTGYFSATEIKLENKKHDLQDSINVFQQRKDTLNKRNKELENRNQQLEDSNHWFVNNQSSLQGSIDSTNSKLNTVEKQKNRLSGEISTLSTQKNDLNKQIADANILLPIKTKIEDFIVQGDHLVLSDKKDEYNTLIDKLRTGLSNDLVKEYIMTKVKDSSILADSKYVILSACFFASNDNYWKHLFENLLEKHFFDEASSNQNKYENSYRGQMPPAICYYSQMRPWSPIDRHKNNKLLLSFVLKNKSNRTIYFEDKVLYSILRFDYADKIGSTFDTLIAPKYDPEFFIDFLKAYKALFFTNKEGLVNTEFFLNWPKIYTAFIAMAIVKDTSHKQPKEYLSFLDNYQLYRPPERPSRYFSSVVGQNYLMDKSLWQNWINNNMGLYNRLSELNFESYQRNHQVLVSDFIYNPDFSFLGNRDAKGDLKRLFSN